MPRQRLVLLSGWGVDRRIWQSLEAYWPSWIEAQPIDWPGYGDAPPLAKNATLEEVAEVMAEPLASDAIWVGWSLGGLLATALLDYLPAPKGLLLLGAGATFCTDDGVTAAQLKAFKRAFQRDSLATWQHFLRWQTQGEPSPRQTDQQLCNLLGDTLPADITTLTTGLHWLAAIDNRPRLVAPPCPVVRLIGEHDPLIAPTQRSNSATLSGVGHCPMLSQPQALAAEIARYAAPMTNTNTAAL